MKKWHMGNLLALLLLQAGCVTTMPPEIIAPQNAELGRVYISAYTGDLKIFDSGKQTGANIGHLLFGANYPNILVFEKTDDALKPIYGLLQQRGEDKVRVFDSPQKRIKLVLQASNPASFSQLWGQPGEIEFDIVPGAQLAIVVSTKGGVSTGLEARLIQINETDMNFCRGFEGTVTPDNKKATKDNIKSYIADQNIEQIDAFWKVCANVLNLNPNQTVNTQFIDKWFSKHGDKLRKNLEETQIVEFKEILVK